jgi:TonB family protein
MQALIHSLNIGTLASWLSIAGFGTVGVIVPQWHPSPAAPEAVETTVLDQDFTLGEAAPSTTSEKSVETAPVDPAEVISSPSELAPMAELEPLPEIPELPSLAIKPVESRSMGKIDTSAAVASGSSGPARRQSLSSGQGVSGATSSSAMSSSSRLAAGRMPPPSYPAESRRKGQTGTVLVEFTVDSGGRVIAAYAKSPSPWPLLNSEAVRTVRGWKFPPGGIMKLQRPIVFQLR